MGTKTIKRAREPSWPFAPIRITSLDDVEQEAASTEAYRIRRSAGGRLLSVDYAYASSETHQTRLIRECRGLLFDARTRRIAARPIHKFFNHGERVEDDAAVDWRAPHQVQEKLDGSLLYPAVLSDGTVLWCTRGGVTETARQAEQAVGGHVLAAVAATMLEHEGRALTPSFEYVGPANRIVLAYSVPRAVLLAVREREEGRYLEPEELRALCRRAGERLGRPLPVAEGVLGAAGWSPDGLEAALERIRAREEGEGVVVAFASGYRMKVKTRRYVAIHRAVSGLGSETHVLQAVLEGATDDWLPVLGPEDRRAVEEYAAAVEEAIRQTAEALGAEVRRLRRAHPVRKDFARAWMAGMGADPLLRVAGFEVLDLLGRQEGHGTECAHGALRKQVVRVARRSQQLEEQVHRGALPLPRWCPRGPEAPGAAGRQGRRGRIGPPRPHDRRRTAMNGLAAEGIGATDPGEQQEAAATGAPADELAVVVSREVDETDPRYEAFKTRVNSRIGDVLTKLGLVEQMAGSSAYLYNETHVDTMFEAVRKATDRAEQAYLAHLESLRRKAEEEASAATAAEPRSVL